MPESFGRPDSPLDADQELIDATLSTLVNEGPDAVSLFRLSELLGRDLDDLQEFFGHPGELLAQLWQIVLRKHWLDISNLAHRLIEGDIAAIDEVNVDLPLRRAAVHLVVVAHRFEELAEVIPNDLREQIASLCDEPSEEPSDELCDKRRTVEGRPLSRAIESSTYGADCSVMLGMLGWIVGIILEPRPNDELSIRQLVANNFYQRCWRTDLGAQEGERQPPRTLVFDQAGPLSGEVLMASTRIVAKGGVSRATLARVARVSGYPPEVVIGMYIKQENLLADFVDSAVISIFGYESVKQAMSDVSNAAMRLSVWLEGPQTARRRALLEVLVAGSHSPLIRESYIGVVHRINVAAEIAGEQDRNQLNYDFSRYAAVVRNICFGLAVIRDAVGELMVEDWRSFTEVALSPDLRSRTRNV